MICSETIIFLPSSAKVFLSVMFLFGSTVSVADQEADKRFVKEFNDEISRVIQETYSEGTALSSERTSAVRSYLTALSSSGAPERSVVTTKVVDGLNKLLRPDPDGVNGYMTLREVGLFPRFEIVIAKSEDKQLASESFLVSLLDSGVPSSRIENAITDLVVINTWRGDFVYFYANLGDYVTAYTLGGTIPVVNSSAVEWFDAAIASQPDKFRDYLFSDSQSIKDSVVINELVHVVNATQFGARVSSQEFQSRLSLYAKRDGNEELVAAVDLLDYVNWEQIDQYLSNAGSWSVGREGLIAVAASLANFDLQSEIGEQGYQLSDGFILTYLRRRVARNVSEHLLSKLRAIAAARLRRHREGDYSNRSVEAVDAAREIFEALGERGVDKLREAYLDSAQVIIRACVL